MGAGVETTLLGLGGIMNVFRCRRATKGSNVFFNMRGTGTCSGACVVFCCSNNVEIARAKKKEDKINRKMILIKQGVL